MQVNRVNSTPQQNFNGKLIFNCNPGILTQKGAEFFESMANVAKKISKSDFDIEICDQAIRITKGRFVRQTPIEPIALNANHGFNYHIQCPNGDTFERGIGEFNHLPQGFAERKFHELRSTDSQLERAGIIVECLDALKQLRNIY